MDTTHLILFLAGTLTGVILLLVYISLRGRVDRVGEQAEKDEAIDAAIFLAQRELRRQVELLRQSPDAPPNLRR